MEALIRLVDEQDFESIYLLNQGLGYEYDIDKTRKKLIRILGRANNRIFVAEYERRIAGYIHAADYECTYVDSLKDILALVVDEKVRGRGIGRALLSAAEAWAKETGSSGVRLVSGMDREKAHRFYVACGYICRKEQKNFIKFFNVSKLI